MDRPGRCAAVEHLKRFPQAGRRFPELPRSAYREVIVPPLRVTYRQEARGVLVVHVVRSEQRLRATKLTQ